MKSRPAPTAGIASRDRWYLVDWTGQPVSVGFRHRAQALAELHTIAAALRRELERNGSGPCRIAIRLAGFQIRHTRIAAVPQPAQRAGRDQDRDGPVG